MEYTRLHLLLVVFNFCVIFSCGVKNNGTKPEQIHLSYGRTADQMILTWTTLDDVEESLVQYGISQLTREIKGYSVAFDTEGEKHRIEYIHHAVMTNLMPGQKYIYRCGSSDNWSEEFTFHAKHNSTNVPVSAVVFGDMGEVNAYSLPRLRNDTEKGMYDLVLHVGDFAYDLDSANGTIGDKFLNMIQPIASALPYMTCPGNHENKYNFTHYKHRFSMPGDEVGDRMFYSFDVGPVHFISISTEYYFYIQYGIWQPVRQYEWLEAELQKASKPENRAKHPWIITLGHRPMYCSNLNHDDCTHYESLVRGGLPFIHVLSMEKLFYRYGVDLAIWAHEHSYERLWPVYDFKVMNGSYEAPYTNPKATVHIISGSAGCQEKHDKFKPNPRDWSAFRSDDYGYSRLNVINSTHLKMEQVSDIKGGKIIDSFMLIKDKHGSYE